MFENFLQRCIYNIVATDIAIVNRELEFASAAEQS